MWRDVETDILWLFHAFMSLLLKYATNAVTKCHTVQILSSTRRVSKFVVRPSSIMYEVFHCIELNYFFSSIFWIWWRTNLHKLHVLSTTRIFIVTVAFIDWKRYSATDERVNWPIWDIRVGKSKFLCDGGRILAAWIRRKE